MYIFSKQTVRTATLALALVVGQAIPNGAIAQSAEGMWKTQPDRKGWVAHVRASRCGSGLCGTIERVFNSSGQNVNAPILGTQVFWGMRRDGNGYSGRAYVPAHKREYDARMQVKGNRMRVSGCLGTICQGQIWVRVE